MTFTANGGSLFPSTTMISAKKSDDHIPTDEMIREEAFVAARSSLTTLNRRRRKRNQPLDMTHQRSIKRRTHVMDLSNRWRLTFTLLFAVLSLITMSVHGESQARDLADNSTSTPVSQTSLQPTSIPSMMLSNSPSNASSTQPSQTPSVLSSLGPTTISSGLPSFFPTHHPSPQPTHLSSMIPSESSSPSSLPTVKSSMSPSLLSSGTPSVSPSLLPTGTPSTSPSLLSSGTPSMSPSLSPTDHPSTIPSDLPSLQPSITNSSPPSSAPSLLPTESLRPTVKPSTSPSFAPTGNPSTSTIPSSYPSVYPTSLPSLNPSTAPSSNPSSQPTLLPTNSPSESPSSQPSVSPSSSLEPSQQPSKSPSSEPSFLPSLSPTASPSFLPSGSPTDSPSFLPSPLPSSNPTVLLSGSPSQLPTMLPSSSPSVRPSLVPSTSPSEQPSARPSMSPSSIPSANPSISPSSSPTAVPSMIPSSSPSSDPTANPTSSPSFLPSLSPSDQPTMKPSAEPSSEPSGQPSLSPSVSPSAFPSDVPSAIPSSLPSRSPSSSPSSSPSLIPSSTPTSTPSSNPSVSALPTTAPSTSPSTRPSLRPSTSPSRSPSSSPSSEPTSIPSQSPTLPLQSFNIEMKFNFDDLQLLSQGEIYHWGNITQERIINELSTVGDGALLQLTVETRLVRQEQEPLPTPTDGSQRRWLQVKRPLNITSANLIEFRTPGTISDDAMTSLVGEAFNNPSDRNAYLDDLQSRTADGTHEVFSTINSVWVDVNGVRQDAPDPVSSTLSNEPGGGVNMAYVIGPVAGGLCALLLTGFFVIRRRNASRSRSADSPSGDQRVSTVIEVERAGHDEVSTLGDPSILPGTMFATGMERDDTVTESIVSAGDYDYTRAYGGGGPGSVSTAGFTGKESGRGTDTVSDRDGSGESRAASGLLTTSSGNISNEVVPRLDSSSLFSDDASFEKQYDEDGQQIKIIAPAGKLGVVIDRPGGAGPMVHAIKDTSVLADQVRVGDRLLSVDGEDTTAYSAIEVSKLISMKANNPSRVLIFLRTRDAEQP